MNPRHPPQSKTPTTHQHMNDPPIHQHPTKHPNNYHNSTHYHQHRQYIPCKYWLSGGCNRTDCWYKHNTTGDSLMAQVLQKMDRLMEKQNMIEKQNMDQMQHVLNRLDEYAKTTSKQTTQLKQLIENDRNELAEALLANSIALQRQKLEQKQELQFMNYGAESGNDLCQSKNGLPPSRSFTFDWTANDETKPVPFANDSAPVSILPTFTSFRFEGKDDIGYDSLAKPTQSEMKHTNDVLKELSFDDKKKAKPSLISHSNTKELEQTSAALITSNTDHENIMMDSHKTHHADRDVLTETDRMETSYSVPKEAINVKDIWHSQYSLSSDTSSEYKASALCGSTSECNPSDMESNTSAFTSEHPTTSGTTILNRKSIKQCVVDEH
eukprot:117528_1